MPPPRLGAFAVASTLLTPRWSFAPTTSARFASTAAQRRRRHHDPYAAAQARARKAANLSRQATLQAERSQAMGDPVRGQTTPFVRSFDTTRPLPSEPSYVEPVISSDDSTTGQNAIQVGHMNHFVNRETLQSSLQYSKTLSTPVENKTMGDPGVYQQNVKQHKEQDANAAIAMQRIMGAENASSKDRFHTNVQRCVDMFGRHNTDKFLRRRPNLSAEPSEQEVLERAGPDTGSSEVQIAILTARIRSLANFLETDGKKDKVNKRNLRLLVHRRQKLMRYLRKRERGGERWQHLVETLGLTEGMFKGEISM